MDHDYTSAPSKEGLKGLPLGTDLDVSRLLSVKDEDIGLSELLLSRKLQPARTYSPSRIEECLPFLQKLRKLMSTRCMRFLSCSNEDSQRVCCCGFAEKEKKGGEE
jgi:hypothetical protein